MGGPEGTRPFLPQGSSTPYSYQSADGSRIDIEMYTPARRGMATPEGYHLVRLPGNLGGREVFIADGDYRFYSASLVNAEAHNTLDADARALRGLTDADLPRLAGGLFPATAPGRASQADEPQGIGTPLIDLANTEVARRRFSAPYYVTGSTAVGDNPPLSTLQINPALADIPGAAQVAAETAHTNGLIPHRIEGGGNAIYWATPQGWMSFIERGGVIGAEALTPAGVGIPGYVTWDAFNASRA